MDANLAYLIADTLAERSYWMQRMLSWFLWGLICAGIGMAVARLIWERGRDRADAIEKENKQLRREYDDLMRQLKGRL